MGNERSRARLHASSPAFGAAAAGVAPPNSLLTRRRFSDATRAYFKRTSDSSDASASAIVTRRNSRKTNSNTIVRASCSGTLTPTRLSYPTSSGTEILPPSAAVTAVSAPSRRFSQFRNSCRAARSTRASLQYSTSASAGATSTVATGARKPSDCIDTLANATSFVAVGAPRVYCYSCGHYSLRKKVEQDHDRIVQDADANRDHQNPGSEDPRKESSESQPLICNYCGRVLWDSITETAINFDDLARRSPSSFRSKKSSINSGFARNRTNSQRQHKANRTTDHHWDRDRARREESQTKRDAHSPNNSRVQSLHRITHHSQKLPAIGPNSSSANVLRRMSVDNVGLAANTAAHARTQQVHYSTSNNPAGKNSSNDYETAAAGGPGLNFNGGSQTQSQPGAQPPADYGGAASVAGQRRYSRVAKMSQTSREELLNNFRRFSKPKNESPAEESAAADGPSGAAAAQPYATVEFGLCLSEILKLSSYQTMILQQTWPKIKPTVFNNVLKQLSLRNATARELFQKMSIVEGFSSTSKCFDQKEHHRMLVDLFDTSVHELNLSANNILEKCARFAEQHLTLCGSGGASKLWDDLGDCLTDALAKADGVRGKREVFRAWILLIAFLIDSIKAHYLTLCKRKSLSRQSNGQINVGAPPTQYLQQRQSIPSTRYSAPNRRKS